MFPFKKNLKILTPATHKCVSRHLEHVERQLGDRLLGIEAGDVAAEGHHQEQERVDVTLWCVCGGGILRRWFILFVVLLRCGWFGGAMVYFFVVFI